MQAKPSEASQGFVSEITFIGVQAEKNEWGSVLIKDVSSISEVKQCRVSNRLLRGCEGRCDCEILRTPNV
jgi:hypothetical protein